MFDYSMIFHWIVHSTDLMYDTWVFFSFWIKRFRSHNAVMFFTLKIILLFLCFFFNVLSFRFRHFFGFTCLFFFLFEAFKYVICIFCYIFWYFQILFVTFEKWSSLKIWNHKSKKWNKRSIFVHCKYKQCYNCNGRADFTDWIDEQFNEYYMKRKLLSKNMVEKYDKMNNTTVYWT